MGTGKFLGPSAELPALFPGRPVQRVEPAIQVAEEDGAVGDQRRTERCSSEGWHLEARDRGFPSFGCGSDGAAALANCRVAVGPPDLAVGRQLVERRVAVAVPK